MKPATSPKPPRGNSLKPIEFIIPVRTVSEANAHTHWRQRQKRAKEQRQAAFVLATTTDLNPMLVEQSPAVRVTMTRLAPRKLDSDNLAGSMKHVRDGIADFFCVDDGSEKYDWQYGQEKSKEYGVRVVITPTGEAA